MTATTAISPAEIYARVADALAADAGVEAALIEDFDGTLASRFGITVLGRASLARTGNGFRLDWNGRAYAIGDPREVDRAELNDAELDLVSAGADSGCQATADSARRDAEKIGDVFRQVAEKLK